MNRFPVTDVATALMPVMADIRRLVPEEDARQELMTSLARVSIPQRTRNAVPPRTDKTKYKNPTIGSGTPITKNALAVTNNGRIPVKWLTEMARDPQISLGIIVMMGIVRGLGWTIDCSDMAQKTFLEFAIKRIYPQLVRSLRSALIYGFSSNEVIYEYTDVMIRVIDGDGKPITLYQNPKALTIRYLKDHYPDSVKIVKHKKTERFLGIAQGSIAGDKVYLKDGPRLFYFALNDHFGNFFGVPRIQGAYAPWFWSNSFMEFMAAYLERRGMPQLVVRYPVGRSIKSDGVVREAKDVALEMGQDLLERSVAAIPAEYEGANPLWDISYLSDDKRAEMFESVLNHLNVLKIRGLGIPDRALAQELSPGGSSAGSRASIDLMMTTMSGFIDELTYAINRKIIPVLQQQNFDVSDRVCAEFKYHEPHSSNRAISKELLVEQLRQTPNFLNAGRLPTTVPSIKGILKSLNIPSEDIEGEYKTAFEDIQKIRGMGSRSLQPSTQPKVAATPSKGGGAK